MKKRRLTALFTAVIMLVCYTVGYAEDAAVHPDEAQTRQYSDVALKTMIRVYAHDIADNYYYGIEDEELLYAVICKTIEEGKFDINQAIEAMINSLGDEYAEFYDKQEFARMKEEVTGEFAGIGVTITQDDKGVLVIDVMKDSPAVRSGIIAGDYIKAVNGESIEGLSVSQVRELIVGAINSEVKLKVLRGDTELEITCIRDTVKVSNIETKMLDDEIAYLRIIQFAQTTPQEIEAYVKEIQSKSVKKLVLDLRNNPGGDLNAAINIANTFISAGRIAELRYKDESKNTYIKSTNYNAPKLKIAVLVNENSASASEFLSTAFKSRGAAKIIGTTTFGKGSMQSLLSLANGAGMKYTIGEFYSTKGERIHTVGIEPDIAVENEYVPVEEESFVKIDYNRMDEAGKDGEMNMALEQRLYALGILDQEPDEHFDDATTQAVKNLQLALGYDMTGIPGFYEYLYVNDFSYDFDMEIDKQLDAAVDYLKE